MYCLNVVLTVRNASDVGMVRSLLTECGRLSRQEPGCIRYEVCHSQNNPQVFILCERWATQADWQEHRKGRAVLELYEPKVLPLVERVPHPSDLLE